MIKCKMCDREFKTGYGMWRHLSIGHGISKRDYIKANEEMPLCKCGCGKPVTLTKVGYREYITGHNRTGKHHSPETRFKIGKANKGNRGRLGQKKTKEERLKNSLAQRGEKNHNWKGGVSYWRNTSKSEYQKIVKFVRNRDNNTCQQCGTKQNNRKFPVHHIIPFCFVQENDPFNMVTVCDGCHNKQTSHKWKEHTEQSHGWEDWQKNLNDGGASIAKI